MRPYEFLHEVWWQQGRGFAFICVRRSPTEWTDYPIKFPQQKIVVPDPREGDVYFSPNLYSRPVRRKEVVLPSRWLYADLDSVNPLGLDDRLVPTVAWQTSPGRYQSLWKLGSPLERESHQAVNKQLTYKIDADRGGWDITQVLRVPGTINHKYDEQPEVKLLWLREHTFAFRIPPVAMPRLGEQVEVPDTSPPDILRKHKLPASVRAKLIAREATGDRSRVLYRLTCVLLEQGLSPGEAFLLLRGTVWNKFNDEGLMADVQRTASRRVA